MEEQYKRRIEELEALYLVEPEIKEVYTEGPEDATIIEVFLEKCQVFDVRINSIDNISFEQVDCELKSNRDRVVFLSEKFETEFDQKLPNFMCVVDRDFDSLSETIGKNKYLSRTDFANLEMYLYSLGSVNKFLKIGIRNFPLTASELLRGIEPILLDLFCLRFVRTKIDTSDQLLNSDKLFKFQGGRIVYDSDEHFQKYFAKNCNEEKTQRYIEEIEKARKKMNESQDNRFFIHGKDFFSVFFASVKKIKNTYGYTEKTFIRSFFSSLEISELRSFKLFQSIEEKYRAA